MKVYVVLCETPSVTDVEKVFLDEKKAYKYADEQNQMFYSLYHRVEEIEVEENA